jgi:hypothetical protein
MTFFPNGRTIEVLGRQVPVGTTGPGAGTALIARASETKPRRH